VCVWVWSSENKPRHLLWTGRRGKDYQTKFNQPEHSNVFCPSSKHPRIITDCFLEQHHQPGLCWCWRTVFTVRRNWTSTHYEYFYTNFRPQKGRRMAQAVGCRRLTQEARFWSRANSCEMCRTVWLEQVSLRFLQFSAVSIIPPMLNSAPTRWPNEQRLGGPFNRTMLFQLPGRVEHKHAFQLIFRPQSVEIPVFKTFS
jgi:hypothetical protein